MGQLTLLMVYNLLNVHASLRLDLKRKKNYQHEKQLKSCYFAGKFRSSEG